MDQTIYLHGGGLTKCFEVCIPLINAYHLNIFFLLRSQAAKESVRACGSFTFLKPEYFSGTAIYYACYELFITPQILLVYYQCPPSIQANRAHFIQKGEDIFIRT